MRKWMCEAGEESGARYKVWLIVGMSGTYAHKRRYGRYMTHTSVGMSGTYAHKHRHERRVLAELSSGFASVRAKSWAGSHTFPAAT